MVMIILYNNDEENFNNNGIGILRDAYNVYINRKINSLYELTFEYPKNGFLVNSIDEFKIVKANGQLFRINSINKSLSNYQITAQHIMYDLNNNFLEDVSPTNQNGIGALNWILQRTVNPHNFTGFSDIENVNSARYVNKNVISAIIGESNSLVKKWNGEIDADNFTIKLLSRLGTDRGLNLSLRKNISGLNISIKTDDVVTKLMPKGYDGLLLPERYVESPLINNYPFEIIRVIEIEDAKVSDEMTYDEAYTLMRNTCDKEFQNGLDKPRINLKVDFVELSKTKEYEQYKNLETVYLGDTVSIFLPEYNFNTSVRVISTTFNVLKNKYEKLELGDELGSFSKQQVNLKQTISDMKEQNKNLLNEAIEAATELIVNALGGYVVKTQSELFIMDTPNLETAVKVWRWNLNGLGYSRTGVNGPYETAITQDGKIVADFITTGVMAVDRIEGLAQTISEFTQMFADIQFNLDNLNLSFRRIGGNNKQRNSVGAYGTSDFEQNQDGSILASEEELLKTVTDNGFGRIIRIFNGKWFKFKSDSLVVGDTYTLSFKYSNTEDNQCIINFVNNNTINLVNTLEEKELDTIEYTFVANTEFVELYVSTGEAGSVGITDYYLQTGNVVTKWQPSSGEMLSTALSIYYNGIKVESANSEIITNISNLGFSVESTTGKILITFNKDKCILSDTKINGTIEQGTWFRYTQNINGYEHLLEVEI